VVGEFENTSEAFVSNIRVPRPCSAHLQQPSLLGPLHLRPGLYCSASRVVQDVDTIIVVSTSTEGLQSAEAVVNSFKLLAPSS
jgi:hypothetical protein